MGNKLVFRGEVSFGTFRIVYDIYKRANSDTALEAEYLYDVVLTKWDVGGERDLCCIAAFGSSFDDAYNFVCCAIRFEVTPISLFDFYEEYLSV